METLYGARLDQLLVETGLERGRAISKEEFILLDRVLPDEGVCYTCMNEFAHNSTPQQLEDNHAVCHDWYHCGPGCCGECRHCGR